MLKNNHELLGSLNESNKLIINTQSNDNEKDQMYNRLAAEQTALL